MSKSHIDVMECDRCHETEEIRVESRAYEWGRITAAQANGPKWIGSPDGKVFRDVCPACMGGLMTWWRKPLDDHEAKNDRP